jgi:hypothetical protein
MDTPPADRTSVEDAPGTSGPVGNTCTGTVLWADAAGAAPAAVMELWGDAPIPADELGWSGD